MFLFVSPTLKRQRQYVLDHLFTQEKKSLRALYNSYDKSPIKNGKGFQLTPLSLVWAAGEGGWVLGSVSQSHSATSAHDCHSLVTQIKPGGWCTGRWGNCLSSGCKNKISQTRCLMFVFSKSGNQKCNIKVAEWSVSGESFSWFCGQISFMQYPHKARRNQRASSPLGLPPLTKTIKKTPSSGWYLNLISQSSAS